MKSFIVSVLIGLLIGLPLLYLRHRSAWFRRAWLDALLGFNLGFGYAAVLLGANLLTNVIGIAGAVVYIAATALNIWRMIRRKRDFQPVCLECEKPLPAGYDFCAECGPPGPGYDSPAEPGTARCTDCDSVIRIYGGGLIGEWLTQHSGHSIKARRRERDTPEIAP